MAAAELSALDFKGKTIRYIVGDIKTTDEIASVLGAAIGKPDLKWVDFTDEDTMGALQQNGLPADIAKNYAEMGAAMRSGEMASEYNAQKSFTFEKTKLEHFSKQFAAVYAQS